ncbi:MAG: DinB family protein [bacterium]|nr:DinB family protein [bacterium]
MDLQTIIANALTLNTENFVKGALKDLSDDDLTKQPNAQCNPIGWTLWHQTRVEDGIMSSISDRPQTWATGNWAAKFAMQADTDDRGIGHSIQQVAAFKASKEDLLAYADAVREKTLAVLKEITPEDLDRDLQIPGGTRKVGDSLGILMVDHFHHSGQIAYLRGYLTGKGWFPR